MTSTRGRIAGIDYGTVRIGIAMSDVDRQLASPWENYNRRTSDLDARYFRDLVQREAVVRFVVGLPVHLSGLESQKSLEARAFGKWLTETTQVEVDYFDERFTTREAEYLLADAQLTKKKRKARLDKLAAQIMLSAYLERLRENPAPSQQAPLALDD